MLALEGGGGNQSLPVNNFVSFSTGLRLAFEETLISMEMALFETADLTL